MKFTSAPQALVANQHCRKHTQSVLAEITSEIAGYGRKVRAHDQPEVWSGLPLGGHNGLETVERHFGIIAPENRLIPSLFKCCAGFALGQQKARLHIARPRCRVQRIATANHQIVSGESAARTKIRPSPYKGWCGPRCSSPRAAGTPRQKRRGQKGRCRASPTLERDAIGQSAAYR